MRHLLGWSLLALAFPVTVAGQQADPKDPKTWTPLVIPNKPKAPEFEDITAWVNSPPLKLADLKGKVVVVHFMAFG